MTKEQIFEIINKLDIHPDIRSFELEHKVMELFEEEISFDSGASKFCLVFNKENFVIKWMRPLDFTDDEVENEALAECKIYQKAKEKGIDFLFPYTEFIGEYRGISFVLQEKVDCSRANISYELKDKYLHMTRTVSDKIMNKAMKGCRIGWREPDRLWIKTLICLYGKRVTKILCEFIQEHQINDLHNNNIGFKNNRPIILDFSGYHR